MRRWLRQRAGRGLSSAGSRWYVDIGDEILTQIPFRSEHIWTCGICGWRINRNSGFQPQPAMKA